MRTIAFRTVFVVLAVVFTFGTIDQACASSVTHVQITEGGSKFYSRPSTDSEILWIHAIGEVLPVMGKTKYFYLVTGKNGQKGYVLKRDCTPVDGEAASQPTARSLPPAPAQTAPRLEREMPGTLLSSLDFTKEWQVRTLRTMGVLELGGGTLAVLGGIGFAAMGGDGDTGIVFVISGICMAAVGAPFIYWGYQDIRRAHQLDNKAFWGNKRSGLGPYKEKGSVKIWFPVYGFNF